MYTVKKIRFIMVQSSIWKLQKYSKVHQNHMKCKINSNLFNFVLHNQFQY